MSSNAGKIICLKIESTHGNVFASLQPMLYPSVSVYCSLYCNSFGQS